MNRYFIWGDSPDLIDKFKTTDWYGKPDLWYRNMSIRAAEKMAKQAANEGKEVIFSFTYDAPGALTLIEDLAREGVDILCHFHWLDDASFRSKMLFLCEENGWQIISSDELSEIIKEEI